MIRFWFQVYIVDIPVFHRALTNSGSSISNLLCLQLQYMYLGFQAEIAIIVRVLESVSVKYKYLN